MPGHQLVIPHKLQLTQDFFFSPVKSLRCRWHCRWSPKQCQSNVNLKKRENSAGSILPCVLFLIVRCLLKTLEAGCKGKQLLHMIDPLSLQSPVDKGAELEFLVGCSSVLFLVLVDSCLVFGCYYIRPLNILCAVGRHLGHCGCR